MPGLNQIPFYSTLIGRPLIYDKKATHTHVLVYGAIEAHNMGAKGCIASNKAIANELGLGVGRVANIISDLGQSGWITVHLNKKNQRERIEPMYTLHLRVNPPSLESEPPLHSGVNIESKGDSSRENTEGVVVFASGGGSTELTPPVPADPPATTTLKMLYDVTKKYGLPILRHDYMPKWAKALDQTPDAHQYLTWLLENDFAKMPGDFKPTLNQPLDVVSKKVVIERFRDANSVTATTGMSEDEFHRLSAKAKEERQEREEQLRQRDAL